MTCEGKVTRRFSGVHQVMLPVVLLTTLSAQLSATDAFRKLTNGEIKARVTGMEITDQAHFSEQYMRDGTVRIVTMGRRIVGKWRVSQGQLCIDTPKPDDARCAEIWTEGPKAQLRVIGDRIPYDIVIQKQQERGWK